MLMELLVEVAELSAAAEEINKACTVYEETKDACKSAGEELASMWQGEGQEAFVQYMENAFKWWYQLVQIVRDIVSAIKKVVEAYENLENTVKGIVGG